MPNTSKIVPTPRTRGGRFFDGMVLLGLIINLIVVLGLITAYVIY